MMTGCVFHHGTVGPSDAPDLRADEVVDDVAPTTCYARWHDHSVRLAAPHPVAELNTLGYERDPFLSDDELEVYFSTDRTSLAGDIWLGTRANKLEPFTGIREASDFTSAEAETKLSITSDGLTAVVGSNRTGTTGGVDVWEATRQNTSQPFPMMSQTKVLLVETIGSDHDPTISANGLRVYIAPDSPTQHLVVASRNAVTESFGMPVSIAELDSGTGDADPSPTPDERILVYASNRTTDGAAAGNLWYAVRGDATSTFDPPRAVPDVNTDSAEGDPHLSADGCRLYFARYTGIGVDWDLYVAAVQ